MQGVLDSLPIGLVLIAGFFAPLAGWLALRKARHPIVWFLLGAVIGPVALGVLALAPPGRCPVCDEPVRGWPDRCEECGSRLRGDQLTDGPIDVPAGRSVRPQSGAESRTRPSPTVSVPTPSAAARPLNPVRPTSLAAKPSEATTGEVLATGLYLSGNGGLEIGATYALARDGDRLRIFGPVDAGQLTVRQEGPIADFEVTAIDDRVIISGRGGRSSLAIVFRMVGGMRPTDLEDALGSSGAARRVSS